MDEAIVYVDGFNLYYGALRSRPSCKWLDLGAFSNQLLLSGQQLRRIRYFTAPVSARPGDPSQPQRQDAYLRALRTVPSLSIHHGTFQEKRVRLPEAQSPHRLVEVLKTEEKGSDVNLATYLLLDAFKKEAPVAIVISDDFDLKEPLRLARSELGIKLGVVSPRCRTWLSTSSVKADFYRPVRELMLRTSQFPNPVLDAEGREIYKPSDWA